MEQYSMIDLALIVHACRDAAQLYKIKHYLIINIYIAYIINGKDSDALISRDLLGSSLSRKSRSSNITYSLRENLVVKVFVNTVKLTDKSLMICDYVSNKIDIYRNEAIDDGFLAQ